MLITTKQIAAKQPCKDRFDNFQKYYPHWQGSLAELCALESITYSDKVWGACKLLSTNQLVKWSILCAESTQHIFEAQYPEKTSLKNLFAYLRNIEFFDKITETQRIEILQLRSICSDDAYAADAREEQHNLNLLLLVSLEDV